MTFDQIIKDIKSKNYKPVYFLTGDEPYYIDQISDLIEDTVLDEGEKAFNQLIVYGKDTEFKSVVDDARQFPMMSSYRVVIVKEAQEMKDIQGLEKYVMNPSLSTILVICYKYKKLDKRTSLAKALTSNAVYFESKKIYDNQVASWITSYAGNKGFKITPDAAGLMAEYIGAELSKLSNELEKLFINLAAQKKISIEDVRDQIGISKNFDVFELQTALGLRNFNKAAMIVRYFGQNMNANSPVMIIASLFSYFNKVYTARMHHKISDSDLAKAIGAHPFFVKEYRQAAQNYSLDHLYNIIQALKKADMYSKGIGSRRSNDDTIYKDILITCMGL
jgi:DNA polymerase-3 subunit delta